MKLKYYLRGIGLGLVLATFILTFNREKESLSDQEIIARARDLGMIMNDEQLDTLLEEAKKLTPTIVPTQAPTATPTPEPTLTPAPTETVTLDQEEITFTITSGMSSMQVANLLKDIGLITDANNFNEYIKAVGKADVIRIGTYTISTEASFKTILDRISS